MVEKITFSTVEDIIKHYRGESEGMKRKFTVINENDKEKYLTKKEKAEFEHLLFYYMSKIEDGREKEGKEPFNTYFVVNTDEPYAIQIAEIMYKHGHWG